MTAFESVLMFSNGHSSAKDFCGKLFALFVSYVHTMVLVPYYLLVQDKSLLELFLENIVSALWWVLTLVVFEGALNYLGYLYIRAELPRAGNEALLNSLKEGVFIIEETSSTVLFLNNAAKNIRSRLSKHCILSLA